MVVKIGKIILVMINRTLSLSLVTFTFTILLSFIFTTSAHAVTSNCVIVNINIQGAPANLPPNCNTGVGPKGITYPPNLGAQNTSHPGYYLMPNATDNAYKFEYPSCTGQHYGSKDLIGALYTVAQRWKQKYPNGRLNIGDLNATGHLSHTKGIDVDMDATTNGTDAVADYQRGNYNRAATIELGKMFIDTGIIQIIFYNDLFVNSDVNGYAKRTVLDPEIGHENHFHVRIDNKYKLPYWEPGC